MVLSSMGNERKCIYLDLQARHTGKALKCNDSDLLHNWANSSPCSPEYAAYKEGKETTEIEIKANRAFKMLELARIELKFWGDELIKIQALIREQYETEEKQILEKIEKTVKNRQEDAAYAEKEIMDIDFDKVLEKRKQASNKKENL